MLGIGENSWLCISRSFAFWSPGLPKAAAACTCTSRTGSTPGGGQETTPPFHYLQPRPELQLITPDTAPLELAQKHMAVSEVLSSLPRTWAEGRIRHPSTTSGSAAYCLHPLLDSSQTTRLFKLLYHISFFSAHQVSKNTRYSKRCFPQKNAKQPKEGGLRVSRTVPAFAQEISVAEPKAPLVSPAIHFNLPQQHNPLQLEAHFIKSRLQLGACKISKYWF